MKPLVAQLFKKFPTLSASYKLIQRQGETTTGKTLPSKSFDVLKHPDIQAWFISAALFEEGDVPGHQMFGFQTPTSKRTLMSRTPRTPKTPKTPQSRKVNGTPHVSNHEAATTKTPYGLRKRLKKRRLTHKNPVVSCRSLWMFCLCF